MARYELGAIYKIDSTNGIVYYVRLLNKDCYGVFAPLKGELNNEIFSKTPYRLFLVCNSFPVKRNLWAKVMPSPDKMDVERWRRPDLARFANFNRKMFLDRPIISQNGLTCKCEKDRFVYLVKSGMILHIFNKHENIPAFLMSYYENYPDSYIISKEFIHTGTPEYQKEQLDVLNELGFNTKGLL